MRRIWVLDTETKGTGAHAVPLESKLKGPAPPRKTILRRRKTHPEPVASTEAPSPPTFKVVDVMTTRVLAEGADLQATLDLAEGARSVVDLRIYVWEPKAERWRLLSLGEQKGLWGLRRR
jgi:hypothetical protein